MPLFAYPERSGIRPPEKFSSKSKWRTRSLFAVVTTTGRETAEFVEVSVATAVNVCTPLGTVVVGVHTLTAVATDTSTNSAVSLPVVVTTANSTLVLHFDFDENFSGGLVPDLSGYANNGIGYNLAHWPGMAPGITGRGAYFPGKANPAYIAVTNWNGIDFLTNGTISIWAKFTTNSYEGSTLLDAGD